MKSFRKFVEEGLKSELSYLKRKKTDEEIANAVSGGNIAGISDVPPNDPPVYKTPPMLRRKKKNKHNCD